MRGLLCPIKLGFVIFAGIYIEMRKVFLFGKLNY